MKMIRVLCAALACGVAMGGTVRAADPMDLFSIKTSLSTSPTVQSCSLPAAGSVLELSAADLENRLGLPSGSLNGITVTALPPLSQGALYLDGLEVECYEYLSRKEVDRLCFVPAEETVGATITFVRHGDESVTTSVTIRVLEEENLPPAAESAAFETFKNMKLYGFVNVLDPEEDSVTIQVMQPPHKGMVTFSGQSFVYEPYSNQTGEDSFTVCAVDSAGNYSQPASISVSIENLRGGFTYADMAGNPSLYAAVRLHQKGVLTGRQIGDQYFFSPDDQVTRGDFLIMLLAATGTQVSPTVNTGLPNDSSLPNRIKPWVKKAMEEKIISSQQSFVWNEIPTRAEAVVLVDRAAKITDVKEFELQIGDLHNIPEWALPSYMDLSAYRMLDLHDGNAYPERALTNSGAADLIWQLYKHTHR